MLTPDFGWCWIPNWEWLDMELCCSGGVIASGVVIGIVQLLHHCIGEHNWWAQLLHHCTAHWASRFCRRPRPQQPPKLVTHWKRGRGHPVVGRKSISPRWEGELETKTHTRTTQWWHPCHALGCQAACIVWGSYMGVSPFITLPLAPSSCFWKYQMLTISTW